MRWRALLASDLDDTLLGDGASLALLLEHLSHRRGHLGLVYATGRGLASVERLVAAGLPRPDALVAEVGAAVHWPDDWSRDAAWSWHLDQGWDPRRVRRAARAAGLVPQPDAHQSYFKCSYDMGPGDPVPGLTAALAAERATGRIVTTAGRHLDVLPARAGKGRAVGYVARRLGVPLERVLTVGDSGNDRDLLAHGGPAALVGNALPELVAAAPAGAYRARGRHAAGVLEALEHFNWLGA